MDSHTRLKVDSYGSSSIEAYLEYKRIVGDDDGGVLFTPEQYEAYKKKVIPQRMQNRLFTSWASPNGIECKLIGPETPCFCKHRYRQHKTDMETIPDSRPILVPCSIRGCGCRSYNYIPKNGSQPLRCTKCKHVADDHGARVPHKCKNNCSCEGFYTSYRCGCGEQSSDHKMIIETKEERSARGRPLGNAVPYQAMGGLTGFSSLADGYMRLDDSGIGAPSKEFLEKPIGAGDHPFLRVHQGVEGRGRNRGISEGMEQMSICGSAVSSGSVVRKKTTEDEDMAFFEKRYQERQKLEKEKNKERARLMAESRRNQMRQDRAKAKATQEKGKKALP